MTEIHSDELSALANPNLEYIIYTLVDITDSKVITPKKDYVGFFQSQNLNTFIQTLSLRTQILEHKVEVINDNISNYGFVGDYDKLWKLTFTTEATLPWLKDTNKLFWLVQDFQGIPVHTKLAEIVPIKPEIVCTLHSDTSKINTRFTIAHVA